MGFKGFGLFKAVIVGLYFPYLHQTKWWVESYEALFMLVWKSFWVYKFPLWKDEETLVS